MRSNRAVRGLLLPAVLMQALPVVQAAEEQQGAGVLEEVVVTSRKREESLSDVPLTVNVLSAEKLGGFAVDDLFDVATLVPGVVFSRAPDDGLALSFRGVANSPRNQAYEQSVGVFLDGVFFGKGRLYSAGMFDLERVEMIKGTQSTLLGKNTSVGAISMVTRKPGQELSGSAQVTAGIEHGGVGFEGGIDIPTGESLTTRIAAYYSDLHGASRNIATGRDVPIDDNHALRLTSLWTPSDRVDVTLLYQFVQDRKIGDTFQVDRDMAGLAAAAGLTDSLALDDVVAKTLSFGAGGDPVHETDSHVASVTVNVDIGDSVLTSQTTYVKYSLAYADDIDVRPGDYFSWDRDESYRQATQELRLASPTGGTFEYLAGVYLFHSSWDSRELNQWAFQGFPPPPAPISGQLFNGSWLNDFRQSVDYWSVFSSATWHLAEHVRLAAGLRYANEDKDATFGRTAIAPFTIWNQVANPPFPRTPLQFSDDFLNGNASLQIDLSDDAMAYLAYGRGTKTGGFAESNTIPSGDPNIDARIDSETVDNYELGLKASLLGGAASVDAAVFYMDIDGLQETIFTGTAFISGNVQARSYGVDVSAAWRATDALTFNAGAVYADAQDKGNGKALSPAPRWTGNLGWRFEHPLVSDLTWRFSGNFRYRGRQFNQIDESIPPAEVLRTLDLTLGIGAADDRWEVAVIGRNVTNEVSQDFGYPNVDPFFGAPVTGAPTVINGSTNALRTVLLQGRYAF